MFEKNEKMKVSCLINYYEKMKQWACKKQMLSLKFDQETVRQISLMENSREACVEDNTYTEVRAIPLDPVPSGGP